MISMVVTTVVGVMLEYAAEIKQANGSECYFYFDLFAHDQVLQFFDNYFTHSVHFFVFSIITSFFPEFGS